MKLISRDGISAAVLIILFGFLLSFPIQAQVEGESLSAHRLNGEFIRTFALDLKGIVTSPGKWESKNVFWISACAGACFLFYSLDGEIRSWIQEKKGATSETLAPYIRFFGKGGGLSLTLAALYVSGEIFQKRKLRETALMGLESWLISGAIVWSIKMLAGRARPLLGESSRSFRPFSFISRYHSFPSGDASSAFAVASVIALRSGSVVAGMLAYSIAAMVALYRVHDDKHWFSDVFLGSVIGYAVGSKIVQLNTNRSNFGVGVGFLPLQGGSGLQISLTF